MLLHSCRYVVPPYRCMYSSSTYSSPEVGSQEPLQSLIRCTRAHESPGVMTLVSVIRFVVLPVPMFPLWWLAIASAVLLFVVSYFGPKDCCFWLMSCSECLPCASQVDSTGAGGKSPQPAGFGFTSSARWSLKLSKSPSPADPHLDRTAKRSLMSRVTE